MADFTSTESDPYLATQSKLELRYNRLRTWVPWLWVVGGVLLLWTAYQLTALALTPSQRIALTGYRFRQVGIRSDSTWWILAHRDGKAALLFSLKTKNTDRIWQRYELGVDSADARALVLDWGGKALMVGDNGVVHVYDSLMHPIDSLQSRLYSMSKPTPVQGTGLTQTASQGPLPMRSVLADKSGQCAAVIGEDSQVYVTTDGGKEWRLWNWLRERPLSDTISVGLYAGEWVSAYDEPRHSHFLFFSRLGYYELGVRSNSTAIGQAFHQWPTPLPGAAVWVNATGGFKVYDHLGNWVTQASKGSNPLAAGFTSAETIVSSGDSVNFLGIDPTHLFSGRVELTYKEDLAEAVPRAGRNTLPKDDMTPISFPAK